MKAIIYKEIITDSDKKYYGETRTNVLNRRYTVYKVFSIPIYVKNELFVDSKPKTSKANKNTKKQKDESN
jgi:hypothetical protein